MKAVICAWYSSDGQGEESIEEQLRECKEHAERQNMNIIATILTETLRKNRGRTIKHVTVEGPDVSSYMSAILKSLRYYTYNRSVIYHISRKNKCISD